MEVPGLSVFRHVFTDCPCGHGTHIGRGLEKVTEYVCEECNAIAGDGGKVLTIVSGRTAQDHALNVGLPVLYKGRTMMITDVEQITKLYGRILTPYVRVVMLEEAKV